MRSDPLLTSRCASCLDATAPCWQCDLDHRAVRELRAKAARYDQELAESEAPPLSGMDLWRAAVKKRETM